MKKNNGSTPLNRPLPHSLYSAAALEAAPLLLGQTLVRRTEDGEIRCRIVETESYGGQEDKGSHAFGGRRTARTETMFHAGGKAYVYLIYGMYHCVNVVTGPENDPQAVLIRAVEPLTSRDADRMRLYRGKLPAGKPSNLSNGPGKLCRALRIDKSLNGCRLDRIGGPLYLEQGESAAGLPIMQSPRINIPYAEEYAGKPWRFYIEGNPYVSVVDKQAVPFLYK
ncbi:DNA-3-methyladenine glycosylase [Paenibacillus sp. DMB20]|uniref:DNA-3-methyladenine glycosylase n=1 Tax=Paenibacillus sp. DMB20 TaxID=1642570 RepID=UPI0006278B43|nr:DNA-3-methyladenine glycosylase [Paenibacillus sp. DMB20]KKO52577.1 3-methyladenine DNA glycosylase [Paenibacillus sp. DMB20]